MSDLIRRDDAREALREVDAWTMPIAHAINSLPAVTVGVKPLVWKDVYRDGRMFEVPRGSNPFGFAAIIYMRHATKWVYDGAGYPSLDAAKAAAQANYEARILAALEPAPVTEDQKRRFLQEAPMRRAERIERWSNDKRIKAMLREPVAAPDPAAIREAALREAHDAIADYPRVAPDATEAQHYDEQIEHSQAIILALIPKGAADDRA